MRIIDRVRNFSGLGVILALLLLLFATLATRRFGVFAILLPLPLLLLPFLARRVFSKPVLVFSAFLLVIVNLDYFQIGSVMTADILISSFFLYALVVRIGLEHRPWLDNRVEKFYLIFLVSTLPSVLLSLNLVASVKNWGRDVEYLILLHFIAGLGLTQDQRRTLVGAIMLSSIIPCVLGFYGMVFQIPDFYGSDAPLGGGELVSRVSSTLAHPGMFAMYLCVVGVLTGAMILDGRWFRRRLLLPLFLVQVVLLYLTFVRAMWLQFVISFAVMAWVLGHRRLVLLGIPVGLVGLAVAVPSFIARWQTAWDVNSENSMIWRLALWVKALNLVPKRPVFGSGPDTFIDYVNFLGFGAHNTWLKLLVETGVIGLVTFVILIIVVVQTLRRKLREWGPRADPILPIAYSLLVGFLLVSLVDDSFEVPPVTIYLWTILGLAISWQGDGTASRRMEVTSGGE